MIHHSPLVFQRINEQFAGVTHNDDLNYLIPTLNVKLKDLMLHNTEDDVTMINIMNELWTNFASTGYKIISIPSIDFLRVLYIYKNSKIQIRGIIKCKSWIGSIPTAWKISSWPDYKDSGQFLLIGDGKIPSVAVGDTFFQERMEFWDELYANITPYLTFAQKVSDDASSNASTNEYSIRIFFYLTLILLAICL